MLPGALVPIYFSELHHIYSQTSFGWSTEIAFALVWNVIHLSRSISCFRTVRCTDRASDPCKRDLWKSAESHVQNDVVKGIDHMTIKSVQLKCPTLNESKRTTFKNFVWTYVEASGSSTIAFIMITEMAIILSISPNCLMVKRHETRDCFIQIFAHVTPRYYVLVSRKPWSKQCGGHVEASQS